MTDYKTELSGKSAGELDKMKGKDKRSFGMIMTIGHRRDVYE